VNRQTLVIVSVGAVLVVGALALFMIVRPRPQPREISAVERPLAPPRPAVTEAPKANPPAPVARLPRRSAEPKPDIAPPPEAPPAPAEAPAPEVGVLHIESDVPGAQVFIDREYIGATPLTAANVKPGRHVLNVSAQGYDGIADTIEVAQGPRDLVIKLKEVRLNSTIDVVHKHRLGSCKGRLVATPRGLRYDTTDRDDAFSSPLMDLETFQVDYLQKNLRVKPRTGKRYDFTDPEGNADRLFVFFRDVDKARERLKRGDPPASD
jgi:hypothetical protein